MPVPLRFESTSFFTAFLTRIRVARARMASRPIAFSIVPEPRTVGDFDRGLKLCRGHFVTTGFECSFGDGSIWDMPNVPSAVQAELHSFAWLDDLVAVGDPQAIGMARRWQTEWGVATRDDNALAWRPDIAAYRVLRWINHSGFTALEGDAGTKTIGLHIRYLSQVWRKSPAGLSRAVALTGLICAQLATGKTLDDLSQVFFALNKVLEQVVTDQGTTDSRNPAELFEVLTLLAWVFRACDDLGAVPPEDLCQRAEVIGPVLRALRHGDGSLARFHGGARGEKGQLDAALAFAGVRAETPLEDAMGFARLTSGASTILLDAASPAVGSRSGLAHASTCGFEMNYRSSPIVVSCGSAVGFDPEFEVEARSSDAHSTLILEGQSTSAIGASAGRGALVTRSPADVPFKRTRAIDGMRVQVGHDGYLSAFGVMHARTLDLTTSGTGLVGEDMLVAQTAKEEAKFEAAKSRLGRDLSFAVRFHLYPDVQPLWDQGKDDVTLVLPDGKTWTFAHDGTAQLTVEPSLYFQQFHPAPRPTRQIVLTGTATNPISRVRWSLVKSDAAS